MKPIFMFLGVGKKFQYFLFCILFTILSFNSKGQVTATESFETLALDGASSFTTSGINFNMTNALRYYRNSSPYGANNSLGWMQTFVNASYNNQNVGSIQITSAATSFRINSCAIWISNASNPVGNRTAGTITFTGTKPDGSTVVVTNLNIPTSPVDSDGWFTVNFSTTALNNIQLTQLSFTLGSTVAYFSLDDFNFTTAAISTNQYSVNDVGMIEGNTGTKTFGFTVSRTENTAAGSVTVATSNGTATTAGLDYVALAPTVLNFAIGESTKTVNVTVNSDVTVEDPNTPNTNDETFNLNLSSPVGGTISDAQGVGTIVDDDNVRETYETETTNSQNFTEVGFNFSSTGAFMVSNGTDLGNGGSSRALDTRVGNGNSTGNVGTFGITNLGTSFNIRKIDVFTGDDGGTPINNIQVTFLGTKADGSGTVTHTATTSSLAGFPNPRVYYTVNFTGTPLDGVQLTSIAVTLGAGAAYISFDNFRFGTGSVVAANQLTINDVSILEGTGAGTTNAVFTVSRSLNNTTFSVNVALTHVTSNATDLVSAFPATTLNFTNGGAFTQTVTVPISRDVTPEPNEVFNMILSSPTNGALLLDATGIGTINDDDGVIETYEDETNNSTTFTQNSVSFSASNNLKVHVSVGSGSGSSNNYLDTGQGNGASSGSVGLISITSANKAFKLIAVDGWTSNNDGTSFASGVVTFKGTLFGGGTVQTNKTITPTSNNGAGWHQNISFIGTPLDNVMLTSLEMIIVSGINYIAIDNFSFTPVDLLPIIELADAGNIPITNGGAASLSNNTDFGTACVTGGTVSKTYTIKNSGASNLVLPNPPNVTLGGANADQFSILTYSGTPITPGGTSSFSVLFNPTSAGIKNATLSISSNDPTNTPFVVNIKGEGIADPSFIVTTNNALNFDGTNDYVRILKCGSGPIFPGGNAITIEYWYKGTNPHSVVRMQPNGTEYIVAGWNGQHIISTDGGTSGIAMGAAVTNQSWHHVAMTWTQNTTNGFKSYLDGRLVAQRNSNNVPLPVFNSEVYLGAFNGSSEFTSGLVDDVRIWTVARTQAEIQAGMCSFTTMQPGLLIYYDFNHGTANGSNGGITIVQNLVNNTEFNGQLNNFALSGGSSNWIPGLVKPTYANTLPTGAVVVTQNVSNNTFIDPNCNIFAKIEPIAPTPVSGNIDVKQWNQTSPTFPYVRRHYEINPLIGGSTAMANITLYFSQADFDAYNATNGIKLPQNPTDASGIANIKLIKYAGTSAPNNNGLPSSYSSSAVDKTGDIISKIWNGQFWEIKLSTTGFSGFFINTASTPLPVNLVSFSGKKTGENENTLAWKTSTEKNFSHFEIQRSENAKMFEKIGEVEGSNSENYQFVDNQAIGLNYYRLKMIDLDGKFDFSKTISIENSIGKSLVGNFYPNPSQSKSFIEIDALEKGNWEITTFDLTGKLINLESKFLQKGINRISIEKLQKGINFVRFDNGNLSEIRKVIRE